MKLKDIEKISNNIENYILINSNISCETSYNYDIIKICLFNHNNYKQKIININPVNILNIEKFCDYLLNEVK